MAISVRFRYQFRLGIGLFTNELQWLIWVDRLSLGLSYHRRLALAVMAAVQEGRGTKALKDSQLCLKWKGAPPGFQILMTLMRWNSIISRVSFQIT